MIRPSLLLPLTILAGAVPAQGAERNYTVTGYDRIRVDGPYSVRLTTGVAPFARASGSQAALDGVAIDVNGRTLVVRPNRSSWGGYPGATAGPVEIEVGTHELAVAWLNGSGSLAVDRVRGLSFELSVQGAGSARIADAAVDSLKIGLAGTASAIVGGSAAETTALVRGISSLDGESLTVKDAVIGAEGPAKVSLTVSNSAKVSAQGAAQVTLAGNPACTVTAAGSATVSGCR